MTKELLQKELDKNNVKVNILKIEVTDFEDYEIIFSRKLDYFISEKELDKNDGVIFEPQEDCLAEDLIEAVEEIKRLLSKKAWYEG